MALLILAFLGGILTIVSPCILPVLPFVFARADQPFRRSGLPLLAGMAITFAALAAMASVGGGWIVRANQYGRIGAMILLAVLGLTLIWQGLADRLMRPFVGLGSRLARPGPTVGPPTLLLGVATGLLWAPCAGPILGLILTGAAVEGAGAHTAFLLLAYAAGAATSLAMALLAGGRVFHALKRSLGAEVWIRRILGVAVLGGVAAVAVGADRGVLTQLSLTNTSGVEQSLVNRLQPKQETAQNGAPGMMMMSSNAVGKGAGPETLPDLSGAVQWLNSAPLNRDRLKGHVVLIDFWTYSCINCLRTLPYVRAWADHYKDAGLIVLGVHTPEFAFEKDPNNVRRAVSELQITYPVPMDNDYAIWKEFHNQFWPADYLVDTSGRIRFHHFGEGKYDETETHIQELLKENDAKLTFRGGTEVSGTGTEAPPDSDVQSPETYVGYDRGDSFLSPGGFVKDAAHTYTVPPRLELNQWALSGSWTDQAQVATLNSVPGTIVFRFHARDVHLVMGPTKEGRPVRFRVKIDGKAPEEDHGVDTGAGGNGTVTEHRLYQLVRQRNSTDDHTFEIQFLDPGVQVFSFTFG